MTEASTDQRLEQLMDKMESNWERERCELLRTQEYRDGKLKQVTQAKEAAELQVVNLRKELNANEERANKLEREREREKEREREREKERESKERSDWAISQDEIHVTDKCLGSGAYGKVFLGKFRGCKVAVKQMHDLILSPHNRRFFEREMNIASRCRHPCLLQFIGATNDVRSPLFVTELMESTLRQLLEQRPLSEIEISVISLDVALALNYLHQSKPSPILHRDINSANVLLWRQGDQWRGKVSDYGTANFMQSIMTNAPGCALYMAPEALSTKQTVKVSQKLHYYYF